MRRLSAGFHHRDDGRVGLDTAPDIATAAVGATIENASLPPLGSAVPPARRIARCSAPSGRPNLTTGRMSRDSRSRGGPAPERTLQLNAYTVDAEVLVAFRGSRLDSNGHLMSVLLQSVRGGGQEVAGGSDLAQRAASFNPGGDRPSQR